MQIARLWLARYGAARGYGIMPACGIPNVGLQLTQKHEAHPSPLNANIRKRYKRSKRVFQRFHFWIIAHGVERLPGNVNQFLVLSVALFGIVSNVERGMIFYSNKIRC